MFYEMILFCSLAGVVGAIISLAEINTEKQECYRDGGPQLAEYHIAI